MQGKLNVQRPSATWNMQRRNADWEKSAADEAAKAAAAAAEPSAEEASAEGGTVLLRSLYLPDQGMFRQIAADLKLGHKLPVRTSKRLRAGCCALRPLHCF